MSLKAGSDSSFPRRVVHLDTGRDWRGGQAQVLLLMNGLARAGICNLLLAPEGPLLERARKAGLHALRWEARGDLDLPALARAARVIARFRPDVVHGHSARAHALGIAAAALLSVPVKVVTRHVEMPIGKGPWSAFKYRLPVDAYVCVSRGVRDRMIEGGIPERKMAVIHSGVALEVPARGADLRALLGVLKASPVVGTVAALTAEKRHEDILEAAARVTEVVPEVHFAWFGEGPRRASLERRRAELGLEGRVHLLGFREDARALAAQCTVTVLASESEGIGTAIMDSQVASVPVVATAVGGIPEVVEDRVTGRLVPPRDPAALAAAVVEALTRPDLAQAWSLGARESVQAFGAERVVERMIEVYRSARDRPPTA